MMVAVNIIVIVAALVFAYRTGRRHGAALGYIEGLTNAYRPLLGIIARNAQVSDEDLAKILEDAEEKE